MSRKPLVLTASVLAAAALAPASALAADVQLGGHPTLRQIDAHHATLQFASDRLPRTHSGKVAARVYFGQRLASVRATGRHGGDVVYRAAITTDRDLRAGTKYTVRIAVPGQDAFVLKVKLHGPRA